MASAKARAFTTLIEAAMREHRAERSRPELALWPVLMATELEPQPGTAMDDADIALTCLGTVTRGRINTQRPVRSM